MDSLTNILSKLETCVRQETYESLETDWLEIKPVPPTGGAWDSIRESVCAFLNTRGGVVILGVKEEKKPERHFTFTGYTEDHSGNVSVLRTTFKDAQGHPVDVSDSLLIEVRPFAAGQIATIRVSPLPEDQKFCFYQKKDGKPQAFRRELDRDEIISPQHVEEQEERKRELETCRELQPVPGVTVEDLSLDRINQLVHLINQGQPKSIETFKSTLSDAVPFLEKKRFMLKNHQITTLGMLIGGENPEEHLLFRSHLDAFVDVPNVIAQDKKTFRDNILQLMESGHAWTLRNILTGVSSEASGMMVPEYPEKLIRESINNALAHRDYSINRPVQITIKPQISLSIRNPGHLPHELVFERPADAIPVRRIFPNPRARNPRLADILKLHNKWEGKGIGMSDLVNCALANQIDLPYYLFHSADELSLCIPSGKVLDETTEAWFDLFDKFMAQKTGDNPLTAEHCMVLAYLLKSERANRNGLYTLALTPGNNHFGAINSLKMWGLIELHPASDRFCEVYVVCRELAMENCHGELRQQFGADFDNLDPLGKQTLNMILLAEKFSRAGGLNAKQVSRLLKNRMPEEYRQRGENEFYRALRYRVERLAPKKQSLNLDSPEWHSVPDRMLSIRGPGSRPTFRLNREYQKNLL
ncbi:MAG: RNA-binding domain-containing protein [Lentisphaeria bacterium]